MKRFTLILIMLIVILILAVPISLWLMIFQQPIKASPDDLIITAKDVPGWESNASFPIGGYSYSSNGPGHPPESISDASGGLHNESTDFSITIVVKSFQSSGAAHEFFLALSGYNPNQSVNGVDEASIFHQPMGVQPVSLGPLKTGFLWFYYFRIANVVVLLDIGQVAVNEPDYSPTMEWFERESAVQPPTQEWMDQIVSIQVQKIQQFNTHL